MPARAGALLRRERWGQSCQHLAPRLVAQGMWMARGGAVQMLEGKWDTWMVIWDKGGEAVGAQSRRAVAEELWAEKS